MSGHLAAWIIAAAASPWVFAGLFLTTALDAVVPLVPSESVVVSLAAMWAQQGVPNVWIVAITAWVAACVGDNVAYLIGARVGVERFRVLRSPRGVAAVARARRGLARRSLMLMMTARYIPLGRTAVHMTAGATGFPQRVFFRNTVIASGSWAAYSTAIGAVAGQWIENHQLLGVVLAMAVALVLSVLAERVIGLWHRWAERRDEEDADGELAGREEREHDDV